MNLNCPLPDLPDLGRLGRTDFCQACDLFPVDMGIDVGPLQARINECKRRYHREVWRILCDGVDGKQQDWETDGKEGGKNISEGGRGAGTAKTVSGAGRPRFGHLDLNSGGSGGERQRDGKAANTKYGAEDILKDLDARDDTDGRRDNRHNRSRPTKKLNNQSNSSDSPATRSRRPDRRRRSRSAGVVVGKNAAKNGWSPIEAELQKLRSSLAAAAALAATAPTRVDGEGEDSRRRRRMTIPESEEADDSVEDSALTDDEGESRTETESKAKQGHTLVVTLSVDSSKLAVAASSRTASFRTDTVTASAPMRIASSADQTALTSAAKTAKTTAGTTATGSGTPTRSATSSSNRLARSEISSISSRSSRKSSHCTTNRKMKTTKSETINSSLMIEPGTSVGARTGARRS